jgi:hypothetical protein
MRRVTENGLLAGFKPKASGQVGSGFSHLNSARVH